MCTPLRPTTQVPSKHQLPFWATTENLENLVWKCRQQIYNINTYKNPSSIVINSSKNLNHLLQTTGTFIFNEIFQALPMNECNLWNAASGDKTNSLGVSMKTERSLLHLVLHCWYLLLNKKMTCLVFKYKMFGRQRD